jgi:hypothetical protein
VIQVYLGYLTENDNADDVRRRFLEAAPFKEKGDFTLELAISSQSLADGRAASSVLWAVTDELRKRG